MITLKTKKSFNNWVDLGDGIQIKVDYPTMKQEQVLQDIILQGKELENKNVFKYQQYVIKFAIKEIKGVDIADILGDRKLIQNNELDDQVWWAIVSDINQAMTIYNRIDDELKFSESDKKK